MAAAAAAERTLASLHEGLLLLEEDPVPFGISIKVASVEAHHAPGLLQLLRKGEVKYGWDLRSAVRVDQLAKVVICLNTVELAVLPLLEHDAKDVLAGRLLQRYAWDIQHLARKVDGREGFFKRAASEVCRILIDANTKLVKEGVEIGVEKVAAMRQAMEGLKPILVHLSDDEPGSGGAGCGGGTGGAHQGEKTIASLHHDGLLLFDEHPGPYDILVNITSVQTRHAPSLLQLLRKGEDKYRWHLRSVVKVDRVAKLCICLDTVALAVLPLLEHNSMDVVAGRLLRRYGRDIQRHARKVDGKEGVFSQAASNVSRLLIDANKKLVKEAVGIGEEKVTTIREAMEGLKPLLVLIPDGEAGGADE